MKLVLISIYVFINLLMFGMLGYVYIVWSQYWKSRNKYQYSFISKPPRKHKTLVEYIDEVPLTTQIYSYKPSFPNSTQYSEKYLSSKRMVQEFKRRIIVKLRSVLFEESSLTRLEKENPYGVISQGGFHQHEYSPNVLLCELKDFMNTNVKFLQPKDVENSALKGLLDDKPLFDTHFNKCAVISNAGALKKSFQGNEINRHDIVLRFNHAPTLGYEVDVGSRTTIRILNSQVVSKPEFNFTTSPLYKNVKLVIWDPIKLNRTIQKWLDKPEYNFIPSVVTYKQTHPRSDLSIVNPNELWKLWIFLQQHTYSKIRLNPPSSGFLGLALLLPYCSSIDMFEFIPSHRITDMCHYFDSDVDPSCTTGVWHPLAAEKLLTLSMNSAPDETVFNNGYVSIPGYSKLKC